MKQNNEQFKEDYWRYILGNYGNATLEEMQDMFGENPEDISWFDIDYYTLRDFYDKQKRRGLICDWHDYKLYKAIGHVFYIQHIDREDNNVFW